jgi:GAF domain-containing protein
LSDSPTPPAGISDPARLAALDGYGILDTPPEPGFDGIVVLARALCAVPVALVSLVAGERQWFKARSGFPACGTDLGSSVCKHVLGGRDLLVIPDLTRDTRTNANPLVTGEPYIRFYAGAPLLSPEGHGIGALCVIDTEPRPAGLTEEQRDCLSVLAGLVMTHLDLRRKFVSSARR